MPVEAWTVMLDTPGAPQPAALVVWRRLREVEVHHVDLAAGYSPTDWPSAFAQRLLREVVADLAAADDAPAVVLHPTDGGHELRIGPADAAPIDVVGAASALAAWLTGRSTGADLPVTPPGDLPAPPRWR